MTRKQFLFSLFAAPLAFFGVKQLKGVEKQENFLRDKFEDNVQPIGDVEIVSSEPSYQRKVVIHGFDQNRNKVSETISLSGTNTVTAKKVCF